MEHIQISDEVVRSAGDMQTAVRFCILYSGKQLKEIAFELGIEASHMSRMVNPSDEPKHFPLNKLIQLMEVCGNEIPLRWLCLRRGYPTPRLVEDIQRENAVLKLDLERAGLERAQTINIFKRLEAN